MKKLSARKQRIYTTVLKLLRKMQQYHPTWPITELLEMTERELGFYFFCATDQELIDAMKKVLKRWKHGTNKGN